MMWQCGVCGYIHEGDGPPDKCPKCGAPKEKFTVLDEKRVGLIERSRFGNSLLMELGSHLAVIMELAELGIEDDLDPACVKLYKECKDFATFARQSLKAEIETHISKGKWG
ncbi:MAG: rubredoxin [Firmicutes bacterium]|nr:rubredoxin [Bacillota bacterium]